MNGLVVSILPPNNLIIRLEMNISTLTTGLKINTTREIGRATKHATSCDFCVDKDFGVISPKIRTKRVITPVAIAAAIPAPSVPNIPVATTVASEEAPIFTMLFPTRIAPSSLLGSSTSLLTILAFLIF